MDTEKMGRFIAERRKDKHMTQKDFARMLNITDKAVSKWERGNKLPRYLPFTLRCRHTRRNHP